MLRRLRMFYEQEIRIVCTCRVHVVYTCSVHVVVHDHTPIVHINPFAAFSSKNYITFEQDSKLQCQFNLALK